MNLQVAFSYHQCFIIPWIVFVLKINEEGDAPKNMWCFESNFEGFSSNFYPRLYQGHQQVCGALIAILEFFRANSSHAFTRESRVESINLGRKTPMEALCGKREVG